MKLICQVWIHSGFRVRLVDFDSDGYFDLVERTHYMVAWIENNTARGGFGRKHSVFEAGGSIETIEIADLDSDGEARQGFGVLGCRSFSVGN